MDKSYELWKKRGCASARSVTVHAAIGFGGLGGVFLLVLLHEVQLLLAEWHYLSEAGLPHASIWLLLGSVAVAASAYWRLGRVRIGTLVSFGIGSLDIMIALLAPTFLKHWISTSSSHLIVFACVVALPVIGVPVLALHRMWGVAQRYEQQRAAEGWEVRFDYWLDYLIVAALVGLVAWIYAPTFKWWYNAWMAEESSYSHGILIPVIVGFIVWLKRKAILSTPVRPCAWGYAVLVPALLLVLLSAVANSASVRGLLFPIVVGGLVLALLGKAMLRELLFPILYLYFMCVLPGNVLGPFSFRVQMLSTAGATLMMKWIGLAVTRSGQIITMPNGVEAQVAEACSGFRLLISLFAFSILFAYLKEGPLWGRLSLVAVTLPLSLVANSFRIALVCLVGQYRGADAMHSFHDYSGYLVLLLAFIILPQIARLVKCRNFSSMLWS